MQKSLNFGSLFSICVGGQSFADFLEKEISCGKIIVQQAENARRLFKKMKTGKNKIDDLTPEQIGKLFPIKIVQYNPNWRKLFEQEKALITKILGEKLVINVEHFGSTSITGLASKPTIDIMVEVQSLNDETKQIITEKLKMLGYENMYNAETENKMTFGKGYDENYSFTESYHIHIREKGNTLQDEIYFRDYLCQNPEVRDEYAKLKYELAEKYQFNREEYTQAKTDFITKITKQQKREARINDKRQQVTSGLL